MTHDTIDTRRDTLKTLIGDLERDGLSPHSDVQHYLLAGLAALDRLRREANGERSLVRQALAEAERSR